MTPRSLSELLETYQAWSSRQSLESLERAAAERGDTDVAAVFQRMLDDERAVTPLDALTAQRELSGLLRGWEWQTVRAARDAGAGWDEIGRITETDAQTAQDAYRTTVERQAAMSAEYGWSFDPGYHHAVGDSPAERPFEAEPVADEWPPVWAAVDAPSTTDLEVADEPVPFVLTDRGHDAVTLDEHGLTGAEGPVLSSGPTVSADAASQALATDGRSLDDARESVWLYQHAASARLGTSIHAWGLDGADLAEIRSSSSPPAIPPPRAGHGDEASRRDQLITWHTADTAAAGRDPLACIERTDQP